MTAVQHPILESWETAVEERLVDDEVVQFRPHIYEDRLPSDASAQIQGFPGCLKKVSPAP